MRYNMVVIALSLLLLASCGEKSESSQATDAGKASVAQGPRQAALIRAGNSGLIPAQPGFVEVDAGSIQAAKSLRLCAVDRINDQKAVGQAIALTGADRIKVGGVGPDAGQALTRLGSCRTAGWRQGVRTPRRRG